MDAWLPYKELLAWDSHNFLRQDMPHLVTVYVIKVLYEPEIDLLLLRPILPILSLKGHTAWCLLALLSSVFFTFSFKYIKRILVQILYTVLLYMHLLFYPCIGVETPSKLHVLTSPQVQCSVTNPHFLSFPGEENFHLINCVMCQRYNIDQVMQSPQQPYKTSTVINPVKQIQ